MGRVDGARIAGFRIFLCWELERGGAAVRAVRAVDTATHSDYQGRGTFSRLTLHAIDALRADRVGFIYNTPNGQSRPGYLKMGWQPVARLPVLARPRLLGSLLAVARACPPGSGRCRPQPGLSAVGALERSRRCCGVAALVPYR